MQNMFFGEEEFQYVLNTIERNPLEARDLFIKYLNKYSKDYYARAYYVQLLIRLNMNDLAMQEYNNIVNEVANDKRYTKTKKQNHGFKFVMAVNKMKLLVIQEKYQELYDYITNIENDDLFLSEDMKWKNYLLHYCKVKLGLITEKSILYSYRYNQVVDYSEELFFDHIRKHEADFNMESDIVNDNIFVPDFPIKEIVNEIKKYIPSENCLRPGYFEDIYFFKYDNCGRVNNKLVNYFTAVAFYNTNHFLTMCPVNSTQNTKAIDLNYMIKKDEPKVKKLSQIDKFNMRYNRK